MRFAALFSMFFAAVLLVTLPQTADAKRFGYGGSYGKKFSMPKRNTTPPATAPRQATPGKNGAVPGRSGASRWLGPLAGLAAGGLIASMLFGDGFEGFQFLDFLLIAALVFGGMMLFRALRARPMARTAGGPDLGAGYPQTGLGGGAPMPMAGRDEAFAPAWFDADSFLKGARVHFIRLQAAWDKGDMKDIATYTTPELFAELQAERLSRGDERHHTEVGQLDAELLSVQRDGDNAVASIRFFGAVKEEQAGEMQDFAEVWHVIHPWDSPEGDWHVAGIEQPDA